MKNRTTKIKGNCLNYENIDRDFDIYCIKKESNFYDTNILDALKDDYKALAVQYMRGFKALVLFKKDQYDIRQLKKHFQNEFGDDVTVDKVDLMAEKSKIKDTKTSEYFYFEGRLLLQLLFNSLTSPKSNSYAFNNISGKLLYLGPASIKKKKGKDEISSIEALNIEIVSGMYLCLNALTFIPRVYKNKTLYVIDKKTKIFRRKVESDDLSNVFHQGNYKNTHASINYLGIGDTQDFDKSKLGILANFCRDVKEKLSDYVDLQFEEFEYTNYEEAKSLSELNMTDAEYGKRINELGLVIVDENKTETSKIIIRKLQEELKNVYGISSSIGELEVNKYNIRIIHGEDHSEYKSYFVDVDSTGKKEKKLKYAPQKDPHNQKLEGYIVQHLVEEENHFNPKLKSSPSIRKIIKELIIKKDIQDRKITISEWGNYSSNKEWTFVGREPIKGNDEHLKNSEAKEKRYFNYYRVLVKKDGSLIFDTFSDKDINLDKEKEKICTAFNGLHAKSFKIQNSVDCLVYSDINNINAIIRTPECPLPNFENLNEAMHKSDGKKEIEIEKIMISLEQFKNQHPEYNEKINYWKKEVEKYPYKISYKKLKDIIKVKTTEGKTYNSFLIENYAIVLNPGIRQKGNDSLYQLSSVFNIQYLEVKDDFDYGPCYKYIVGYKDENINRNYPRQCVIRKIVSWNQEQENATCSQKKIVINELLPMMTVDYVKEKQFTVVPFPLKYLRDWKKQIKKKEDNFQ